MNNFDKYKKTLDDYVHAQYDGLTAIVADAKAELEKDQAELKVMQSEMTKDAILGRKAKEKEIEAAQDALQEAERQRAEFITENYPKLQAKMLEFVAACDRDVKAEIQPITDEIAQTVDHLKDLLRKKADIASDADKQINVAASAAGGKNGEFLANKPNLGIYHSTPTSTLYSVDDYARGQLDHIHGNPYPLDDQLH